MPLRSNRRETCQGSSDNVFIPPDEFRSTIDGAVRIARYDVRDSSFLDLINLASKEFRRWSSRMWFSLSIRNSRVRQELGRTLQAE